MFGPSWRVGFRSGGPSWRVGFRSGGVSAPIKTGQLVKPVRRVIRSATTDWRIVLSGDRRTKSRAERERANALGRIDQFLRSTLVRFSPEMFKYVGALGSGSNETEVTHEINKLTGQHVAIKQIPKYRFTFDDPEAGLPNFMREVTALHRLRKACTEKKTYVLCGLGFYEDDEYWYLVTEFSPDLMPM